MAVVVFRNGFIWIHPLDMIFYRCGNCKLHLLQMVNSAIRSTLKFLRLKVFKTMEKCKLQMAANRRALKSLQHFQEKCPHASWVEMELGHLRNELENLEDKMSQTKFHVVAAKWVTYR